ncbi:hypothetical protein MB901379_00580 [Mycobacterium basiliense]|uniref:Uncharacterized protein n=1 Tax=Mycobacterium basiliense TaxID=2094119 RepID=A0A447G997_9MYCO|nr:hypothetical protein MB901379_00580 [Mycobacterium basiliense]
MVWTDGADWDLSTGVGTAGFGATARAVATGNGLLDDRFAEALVRAASVDDSNWVIDGDFGAADGTGEPTTSAMMDILSMTPSYVSTTRI